MGDPIITNIDQRSPIIDSEQHHFEDDTITIAASTTVVAGTILARDSVSNKLVPYVVGGVTNEDGIPKTVMPRTIANATGGALDYNIRAPESCTVRRDKVVIQADGDNSNLTKAIEDQLRDYGIKIVGVNDNSVLDNQ